MLIERLQVSAFQANCYIVADETTGEALIIDAGDEADVILDAVRRHNFTVKLIIATHGHIDHVMAVGAVKDATGAPFVMHAADKPLLERLPDIAARWLGTPVPPPPLPDRWLVEGESVGLAGMQFRVRLTPGHSAGSVSLVWEAGDARPEVRILGFGRPLQPPGGIVFIGDALFAGSIGRTDLGGDFPTLERSIHSQLFTLPDDTLVLSGHGGPTFIGHERKTNPFVGEGA